MDSVECTSPEMFTALTGKQPNAYHLGNQLDWQDWVYKVGFKEASRLAREYVRAEASARRIANKVSLKRDVFAS